jgi:hypothetical protein
MGGDIAGNEQREIGKAVQLVTTPCELQAETGQRKIQTGNLVCRSL